MRVAVSVEVDDDYRKALAYRIDLDRQTRGEKVRIPQDPAKMRLATRKEIQNALGNHLEIEMGEIVREVGIGEQED